MNQKVKSKKNADVRLFIDSSNNQKIVVRLSIHAQVHEVNSEANVRGSQVILKMIDRILKDHNLSIKDIAGVEVNEGPGSYTGLRVGITIANTLAFVLGVPINNKRDAIVTPVYE